MTEVIEQNRSQDAWEPLHQAYHAGIVRATLFSDGLVDDSVFDVVHKISAVRNAVSGPADDDQDLGTKDVANLVPTDEYGRAFGRTAAEILNIVYLDPHVGSSGGFYSDGLNGDIIHGTGSTTGSMCRRRGSADVKAHRVSDVAADDRQPSRLDASKATHHSKGACHVRS